MSFTEIYYLKKLLEIYHGHNVKFNLTDGTELYGSIDNLSYNHLIGISGFRATEFIPLVKIRSLNLNDDGNLFITHFASDGIEYGETGDIPGHVTELGIMAKDLIGSERAISIVHNDTYKEMKGGISKVVPGLILGRTGIVYVISNIQALIVGDDPRED